MSTVTMTAEEFRDWADVDGWRDLDIVSEEFSYQSRWSSYWQGVFRKDGRHYQILGGEGSTENVDHEDYSYDVTEVQESEKTIKVWIPVQ